MTHGFRDVRWAGGPLELRPRNKGAASARLQYPLHSQFPLSNISVQAAGKGALAFSASPDGRRWTAARSLPASGALNLTLANDPLFKNSTDVWVRVDLKGTARAAGEVVASLQSLQVKGNFQEPQVKEIELPVATGTPLQWKADMNGALLFTSNIDNAANLVSERGSLGIRGTEGNANVVTIRQKFVCPAGLDLQKVISVNSGDQPNYGATNKLGLSLDGTTVLTELSTSGVANNAELSLDLASQPALRNVKEFWVFLTMTNGSGVKTAISNRITGLRIEGMGFKPAKAPVSQ